MATAREELTRRGSDIEVEAAAGGKPRVYRSRTGCGDRDALTEGLPQSDCYVNVLRDAMAVDALDEAGIYFGTTGGQVYASTDGGDRWRAIAWHLPPVLSVEAQTLR